MTPQNYARMFHEPQAMELLYWIQELVGQTDPYVFEVENGSTMQAAITNNSATARTLKTQEWNVLCEFDQNDKVNLRTTLTVEDSPWQAPIRSIMRCMGMPPRKDVDQVQFGLACLENAIRLRNSIVEDAFRLGNSISSTDIATLIVGIENLVGEHVKACTEMINTGSSSRDVEDIEAELSAYVDDGCRKLKISPIALKFNRDSRGGTVFLSHARKQEGMDSTVDLHHCSLTLRMLQNPIRDNGFVSEAQVLQEESKESKPPAVVKVKTKTKIKIQSQSDLFESSDQSKPRSDAIVPAAPSTSDQPNPHAKKIIAADLIDILRDGSWSEGKVFKIPDSPLERKLYERVAEAIKLAGGKWSVPKKGFVFKEGADKFVELLATGKTVDRKDFDYFPTPQRLVQEMVRRAQLEPGMLVLEPSAGRAAIAEAAAEVVGRENVVCFEFLPENVEKLKAMGYNTTEADFLSIEPTPIFDRILMNPPFGAQADMRHVEHAARFLKPDGKLVSIMSLSYRTRETKLADSFRTFLKDVGESVMEIESGAFKESGTNVPTVMVTLNADLMPWNLEKLGQETTVQREVSRG